MDIKNCIKEIRKELGFNQRQFAQVLFTNQSAICQIEKRERILPVQMAIRLIQYLSSDHSVTVSLDEIYCLDNE